MPDLLKLSGMITPEPTRMILDDGRGLPLFLLTGPAGVISYRPAGMGTMIDVHAVKPLYAGDEPGPCHLFSDCCHDAGTGGAELARLHAEQGDEAVWAELEVWYAELRDLAATDEAPALEADHA